MLAIENAIRSSIELQDIFNSRVYGTSDWRQTKNPLEIAYRSEMYEAIDHIGYKWWKQNKTDIEQAFIELIDAYHFALSLLLIKEDNQTALTTILDSLANSALIDTDNADIPLIDLVDEFALTNDPKVMITGLFLLTREFGYTVEEFYQRYIQKNVLNQFRQDHGYLDGTYIKIWNGCEDNVILCEIVDSLTLTHCMDRNVLYQRLEEEYSNVAY